MMSKKQLGCMLTLHIIYLLLGASIFYHIESPVEMAQRADEKLERLEIQNLLYENYIPSDPEKQDSILKKLSEYCGKSMFNYTTEDEDPPIKWDFYHSFFFSYTVVSTIGYGNLAPTTHLSRILMIFYGLFGIPINGILLANLGEYFGLQLITVYRRYKKRDGRRADMLDYFFLNLGMLGQIFIYLVPGFLFFIFLPACLFVLFEGWDYVAAVYYAFVTLTTIGFGDLVAGTVNNGFAATYFMLYKLFLIVWITFGLGYIVMLLGFITSGMRSEGVHKIEQKIASQWRSTQNKILHGFTRDINVIRKLINEANLIKLKPIYVETAPYLYRSKSCPVLSFDVEPRGPIYNRKRANSENIHLSTRDLLRIQSDTDLLGIDKERTFTSSAIVKPADLLARVVNVLGGLNQSQEDKGVHMFDDDEILSSEKPYSWSIGQNAIISQSQNRTRALSVAVPNYRKDSVDKLDADAPWSNGDFKDGTYKRAGKLSLPTAHLTSPIIPEYSKQPKSILSKIFQKQSSFDSPADCIKNTMKNRMGHAQEQAEEPKTRRRGSIFPTFFSGDDKNDAAKYKEKTKRGRGSIFPTFDFNDEEDDNMAKAYKEKTSRGRHSIFPTFDFSEEEDAATAKAYRQKSKRHSIFPTFDFTEDEDEDDKTAKAYKEKTRSGRHSIFPTFDFSESEDDIAKKYKEKTKQGRRGSIFPTFDFGGSKDDDEEDDTIDEDEVRKYQSRTQRGRMSLFPTFGKSKKSAPEPEDTVDEMSEELQSYQNKTRKGRGSLFPTFGKARKSSVSEDDPSDLEASIRQYQNQTKRGRGSLSTGDTQNMSGGRQDKEEEEESEVLEQTSVADLLRALAVLESANPNAKRGSIDTSGILSALTGDRPSTGPPTTRRRGSVHPDFALPTIPSFVNKSESDDSAGGGGRRRRVSARAAAPQFTPTLATVVAGAELQTTAAAARENRMNMVNSAVLESGEGAEDTVAAPAATRTRRFSPAGPAARSGTAPVSRRASRIRQESVASIEEEEDSRRGSLTDIVIDNNKDNT